MGDHGNPGSHCPARRVVLRCLLPDLEKHFLGHFLGVRAIAENPLDEPVNPGNQGIVELLKTILVPIRGAFHEVLEQLVLVARFANGSRDVRVAGIPLCDPKPSGHNHHCHSADVEVGPGLARFRRLPCFRIITRRIFRRRQGRSKRSSVEVALLVTGCCLSSS